MGQRVANLPPLTPSPSGQTPAEEEPSRPADHLHERGWPGRLLQPGTWLGGGDGGPRWRRGTRWVLQGEVGRSGPTSPSLACRVGWECLQAGGWGAAVGTFPKSFPVALGLATSAPHPPPPSFARPPPTLLPKGEGSLSGTMCRGDRVSRERPGEGAPRSRRERPAAQDPAWMRGGQGRADRAGRG